LNAMHRIAAAVAASALLAASPAFACSICRCGDATFNSLGVDVFSSGRFRLAVDWDRLEKENGLLDSEAGGGRPRALDAPLSGTEREVENRLTATFSYSVKDAAVLVARLPWTTRTVTTDEGGLSSRERANGLSDPEVYALVRLWSSRLAPALGRRASVSVLAGVKTPWGENDQTVGGERLDEHLQPGTGSTDVFAGLTSLFLLDPKSSAYASFQYRRTGSNDFGYRYGRVTLANAGYERKLSGTIDAVLELNYRHAEMDLTEGARDPNTGGDVLYVSPRVLVDLGRGLVGRLTVQVPAVRSLYGDQTERTAVNAGLTMVF
jgi:hypothetical protein